ncbi:MAG TPA: trypsin-like peptidase domain-containing protein [Thermoleophilaceae bacterium]|nr:trypsin-like peptidase domain-containing protein [Thermoleophilaceae bacterium]
MSTTELRPPRLRTNVFTQRLALALASGVIGAAAVTGLLYATGAAGDGKTQVVQELVRGANGSGSSSALDASAIYAAAVPGVADITSTTTSKTSSGAGAFPFSPPGRSQTATGTGFEIDSKGHILTADHVVAGASSVSVRLQDGTSRSARVLGTDRSTDAAVLEIDASGLTMHPLPLGSSQALGVGNPLAVIGDPFNYNRSLSTGVVSALNRTIQAPDGFTIADALQTDAAINPGNSGGPVLNARGRVVGITDQIATGSSGSDSFTGVGFAVPIDDVKAELSQLQRGIHVSHAYLGVGTSEANGDNGAPVASVPSGSPAAQAGLRSGDLVTAVNGKAIHGPNGLVAAVEARRPGDKLTLTVQRGSDHITVTVTLGTQPRQS